MRRYITQLETEGNEQEMIEWICLIRCYAYALTRPVTVYTATGCTYFKEPTAVYSLAGDGSNRRIFKASKAVYTQ